jgi:hypothetical protein
MTVAAIAAIKGKPCCPEPPQLDITTALLLPPASLGHPATSPSLPSVSFLTEPAAPPSSSTMSRRSSEVGRKKDSSRADTHDSVLGRVRVASLDAGRDVSLYRRRNMSAISCSCAHSTPVSSWTAMSCSCALSRNFIITRNNYSWNMLVFLGNCIRQDL